MKRLIRTEGHDEDTCICKVCGCVWNASNMLPTDLYNCANGCVVDDWEAVLEEKVIERFGGRGLMRKIANNHHVDFLVDESLNCRECGEKFYLTKNWTTAENGNWWKCPKGCNYTKPEFKIKED